jgi:large repetitive protein
MRHTRKTGAAVLAVAVPLAAMAGLVANTQAAVRIGVGFTAKPAAITKSADATFGVKASVRKGVKGVYYRIDGSRWKRSSRAISLKNLADGAHVVQVKLVMRNGRAAAATYRWRVDTRAPETPMVYGGDTHWSSADAHVVSHFASTDPAPSSGAVTYERRVSNDGGATWGALSAGDSILVSREGDTRVQYRAIDRAGNASVWAEAIVRLDRTKPTAPTATGGSNVWKSVASVDVVNQENATDTGSGVASGAYEMQIREDGDPFWVNAQIDGGTLTVKQEGVTQVRFRAVDRAGNAGDWSAAETIKLDRTAPEVPLVPTTKEWSGAPRQTVEVAAGDTLGAVTSSGVDHYLVKASPDGMSFSAPAVSDGTFDATQEGYTYLSASACDAAGNCSRYSNGGLGPVAMLDHTPPGIGYLYTGASTAPGTCSTFYEAAYFTLYGAGDIGSGIDHWIYRATNDSGVTVEGTDPSHDYVNFTLTNAMITGLVHIQFAAVDRVGNVGEFTDMANPAAEVCLG